MQLDRQTPKPGYLHRGDPTMTHKKRHNPIIQLAAIALLLSSSFLSAAEVAAVDDQSKPKIDIAAGPAGQALKQFIAQTGLQLLFDYNAVNRLTTQPVNGHLEAAEALKRMLEGTGLTFEFVNERTVTVTS